MLCENGKNLKWNIKEWFAAKVLVAGLDSGEDLGELMVWSNR